MLPENGWPWLPGFNVANDEPSVGLTNAQVIERFYSGLPINKREMGEFETLYCIEKAHRLVGFSRAIPAQMS